MGKKQRLKGKKSSVKSPVETVKAAEGAVDKIQTEKYDLAARIARCRKLTGHCGRR